MCSAVEESDMVRPFVVSFSRKSSVVCYCRVFQFSLAINASTQSLRPPRQHHRLATFAAEIVLQSW